MSRQVKPGYVWVRLGDKAAGGSWQDPTHEKNSIKGYGAALMRKTPQVTRLLGAGGLVELDPNNKLVDEAVEAKKEDEKRKKAATVKEASSLGEANAKVEKAEKERDDAVAEKELLAEEHEQTAKDLIAADQKIGKLEEDQEALKKKVEELTEQLQKGK